MSSSSLVNASRRVACAVAVLGCACGEPAPVQVPRSVASASASATASASAAPAEPTDPQSIASLTTLVPPEATFAVGVPGLARLSLPLTDARKGQLRGLVLEVAEARLGLAPALGGRVVDALDEAVVFGVARRPGSFAVAARLKDPALAADLAGAFKLKENGPDEWVGDGLKLRRFAAAGVVIAASDAKLLEAATARARGAAPPPDSLVERASSSGRSPGDLWAVLDLTAGASPESNATMFVASLGKGGFRLEQSVDGPAVPRLGEVLAPVPGAGLGRLPYGPIAALTLSTKRVSGQTVADLVRELSRTGKEAGPTIVDQLIESLLTDSLGLTAAELDTLLGDEISVGVYRDPDVPKAQPSDDRLVLVASIDVRDEARAKDVLATLRKKVKAAPATKDKPLVSEDPKRRAEAWVDGRRVLVVFGSKKRAASLAADLHTYGRTLGGDSAFFNGRKKALAKAHLLFYADAAALAEEPGAARGASFATLTLAPRDQGLGLTLLGFGGGDGSDLGYLGAATIDAFQQYLLSAKTAEAKNTVSAIARGAIGAFERETMPLGPSNAGHKLCGSAPAVPSVVPAGKRYTPAAGEGADFHTGDAASGWRCLKFDLTSPAFYQYEYRAGSGYKGPKRGGPDPGKGGFEASAEGDLDGDGKTSLFTVTGKVDPKTGTIKLSDLFVSDELE